MDVGQVIKSDATHLGVKSLLLTQCLIQRKDGSKNLATSSRSLPSLKQAVDIVL